MGLEHWGRGDILQSLVGQLLVDDRQGCLSFSLLTGPQTVLLLSSQEGFEGKECDDRCQRAIFMAIKFR